MKCGCCHKCHPALQKQLWCGANQAGLIQRSQLAALSFRIFNGFDGIEIEDIGSMSKLTFHNVSETDYGNYTCVAINKLGSANTSMFLFGKLYTWVIYKGGWPKKLPFLFMHKIYISIALSKDLSKVDLLSIALVDHCFYSFVMLWQMLTNVCMLTNCTAQPVCCKSFSSTMGLYITYKNLYKHL